MASAATNPGGGPPPPKPPGDGPPKGHYKDKRFYADKCMRCCGPFHGGWKECRELCQFCHTYDHVGRKCPQKDPKFYTRNGRVNMSVKAKAGISPVASNVMNGLQRMHADATAGKSSSAMTSVPTGITQNTNWSGPSSAQWQAGMVGINMAIQSVMQNCLNMMQGAAPPFVTQDSRAPTFMQGQPAQTFTQEQPAHPPAQANQQQRPLPRSALQQAPVPAAQPNNTRGGAQVNFGRGAGNFFGRGRGVPFFRGRGGPVFRGRGGFGLGRGGPAFGGRGAFNNRGGPQNNRGGFQPNQALPAAPAANNTAGGTEMTGTQEETWTAQQPRDDEARQAFDADLDDLIRREGRP